ncbi:MAG: hypothetical protein KGL39_05735 [Patescibacteria group bacterium]|nr:hypothetical protein [Patescibacteria group bacterium]
MERCANTVEISILAALRQARADQRNYDRVLESLGIGDSDDDPVATVDRIIHERNQAHADLATCQADNAALVDRLHTIASLLAPEVEGKENPEPVFVAPYAEARWSILLDYPGAALSAVVEAAQVVVKEWLGDNGLSATALEKLKAAVDALDGRKGNDNADAS